MSEQSVGLPAQATGLPPLGARLRSRFSTRIDFLRYTADQLHEIAFRRSITAVTR